MIPIYSIESWFSLRFRKFALTIETFREFYEAYVLYNFLYYLISLLGNEAQLLNILKKKSLEDKQFQQSYHHPLYFHLFLPSSSSASYSSSSSSSSSLPWSYPTQYLNYCKLGVFQYILIKAICSIFILLLEHYQLFHEGSLSFAYGYVYICILSTLSQLWALYCLSIFYLTFKEELLPWKPVGKFLSVKMVLRSPLFVVDI